MNNLEWNLKFISKEDLIEHVKLTINTYGNKLESIDLKRFNKNIIDPIKLIFDKSVYKNSWEETIKNEIYRQRDKSNNNDIGYFHQRIFQYIDKCIVPPNGTDGGWDIIVEDRNGFLLSDGTKVERIYVEMKNKHNTMNSASAAKTYMKMQNQILKDDNCACFLVEAIAKKSQEIKWEPTVDGTKIGHRLIKRVSLDQFYSIVTGESDAFYQLCIVLPHIINEVISDIKDVKVPNDTAFNELKELSKTDKYGSEELSIAMAIYLLGFSTYIGFDNI